MYYILSMEGCDHIKEYNFAICAEKHKRLDEQLQTHERRLNNHGNRLDQLEQYKSKTEVTILHLCEKIDGLVSIMKWFIGLVVGAFVTFFFYAAQRGLIK